MNVDKILSSLIEFNVKEPMREKERFRILSSGGGHDGRLFLEKKGFDLMRTPKWEQVPFGELLGKEPFESNERWRTLWAQVAVPAKWSGTILDTRKEKSLPVHHRGVIHVYSSRNDHAPDDEEQDAYVVVKKRGADFISEVEILEEVTKQERREDLFLGALYVMLRKEQEEVMKRREQEDLLQLAEVV